MQIETLVGLDPSQISSTLQNKRVAVLSPRLRNRNVLLSMFVRGPDTLYYQLTSNDTGLTAFLDNLVATLSDVYPDSWTQLSQARNNKRASINDYADALAADLKNLKPRIRYFVLDEFDFLTSSDETNETGEFFQHFVARLPESITLVINARTLPFSPWDTMLQAGEAVVLGEQMALDGGIFVPGELDKPHLEVYGFGSGSVYVDGRLIDTWDGPLPRNLFFYFVDHNLITRDEIFATFWPGLPKKEATNVFHVTKRKISERLGYEVTDYSGGFYRPTKTLAVHYDVADFEEEWRRGDSKRDGSEIEDWYKAIHLYRSEFLHNVDMPWINERRETLQKQYTDALIGVGRIFKSLREMDKAVHYYIRAIREQPNREDIHREVMSIYHTKGEADKAVAQYRQLERILRRTLNIKPSPATVLLYNMITGQNP
jgi:DNA-binding SARP family transcriptional activator